MAHNSRPFLIAGNWKMNLCVKTAAALSRSCAAWGLKNGLKRTELLLCPAYVHIWGAIQADKDALLQFGGQDCTAEDNGAHTGDISAEMLKDMGCSWVILGHSERRSDHGESDIAVNAKAKKAIVEGLDVVLCVGETLEQREAGKAKEVVEKQLRESIPDNATGENMAIAYEPVWAIGTGKTATADDVKDMHSFINEFLSSRLAKAESLRIIYGGSVKPENAKELLSLPHVSGALIGGASLKAESFLGIAEIASEI